jgi:hypothetical protein
MRQREPGFLYGLNAVDIVKIALAFMLSLAGFYLMWRTFFGPPMFDPTAIQAQVSKLKLQNGQRPENHPGQQGENSNAPAEVSVGIAPSDSAKRH